MSSQIRVSKRAGRLGVTCLDAPDRTGAVIAGMIDGSTAYQAGLNVGDKITAVNGKLISGHRECVAAIDAAADVVSFVLSRPTRRVVLDKRDGRIGVTLTTPQFDSGVLVCALEENSLGFDAGLFVGDTVLSINGELAESHGQAVGLVDAYERLELVVVANTRQVTLSRRASGPHVPLGLTVANRVDGGEGVVVIGLQAGGLAIRQLQLGDTLMSVDGELVSSHDHAIDAVDGARGAVRLVLGQKTANLADVLNSVQRSSTGREPAPAPGCEPVFQRHEPLHERLNSF